MALRAAHLRRKGAEEGLGWAGGGKLKEAWSELCRGGEQTEHFFQFWGELDLRTVLPKTEVGNLELERTPGDTETPGMFGGESTELRDSWLPPNRDWRGLFWS